MSALPIIEHFRADPPLPSRRFVERLAKSLRQERPGLALPESFRALAVRQLDEGPVLHIDDLSAIPRRDCGHGAQFYQDRARLRAGDGDWVASCGDPIVNQEMYCRDYLGLGSPKWLHPRPPRQPLKIAEACWQDTAVRNTLIRKVRRDQLRYFHPHMGTIAVWELAFLLHSKTHCPLKVIAPPPGVTIWVNDKIAFANTVARLLGPEYVPTTRAASNVAYMARRVQDLADQFVMIGLKQPNSGGGEGNLVLNSLQFRDQPLPTIREILKECLRKVQWEGPSQLLISGWETEVVCSPSVQLWIPPQRDAAPIVEGVFVQMVEGLEGHFVGNAPAHFPRSLNQELVDHAWLLACLFQSLGYVGRCSFDTILVGTSVSDCRVMFVECNGRWGGTSLLMTLMNRIFDDWARRPYASRVMYGIPGLDKISFSQLLEAFQDELFDIRTGQGSLIFVNPGRLKHQAGITVIALGDSQDEAWTRIGAMPERLRRLAQGDTGEVIAR